MLKILESVPTWKKWTGGSLIIALILVGILLISGAKEVAELPSTIEETRENVTEVVLTETVKTAPGIIGSFKETGEALAETVEDPMLKVEIIGLMTLVGVLFFVAIFLAVLKAIGIIK